MIPGLLVLALPTSASAAPAIASTAPAGPGTTSAPATQVLSTDVVAPVQLAVRGGRVLVGDAARSTVTELGRAKPLAVGPAAGEVNGVDLRHDGSYAFTSRAGKGGATAVTLVRGTTRTVVDLGAFEATHNPDGSRRYGTRSTDSCVTAAIGRLRFPDPRPTGYQGLLASNPYSVASDRVGGWYVADASANDLLRVTNAGRVSVAAVLPAIPYTFTAKDATALGLPGCLAGVRYEFESTPTDVEVGPDGMLYVTAFPGGPIGADLPPLGQVLRIDPRTGRTTTLADGLSTAINLAVGAGQVYVAELLPGRVSVLRPGGVRTTVARIPRVAGLEYAGGALYASALAPGYLEGTPTGPGSVLRITP